MSMGEQFTYVTPPTVTNLSPPASAIAPTSAMLGGDVTSDGGSTMTNRGVLYTTTSMNANPTLNGTGVTEVDDAAATVGVFTESITGLTPGTEYSFVAFATNSVGTTYTSPASTFTTLMVAPSVTTPISSAITATSATLGGDIISDGGSAITNRGVLYATTSVNASPTFNGTGVTEVDDAVTTTGLFTESITGLTPGASYSFVAFATNSVGTTYSSPTLTFTTLAVAPSVTTPTTASITSSTAILGGDVTSTGGAAITKRGVLYAPMSVNANPTLNGTIVTEVDDANPSTGVFTESITGLTPGTEYSFVAFAINSAGTTYTSPASTFITPAVAPTVTTPTFASITGSTAILGGTVTSTGGAAITKRGVLYATTSGNANPTLNGTGVTEVDAAAATVGVFTESITGLTPGTEYSFVAFATNSVGTTYTSPASTFTTLAVAPSVTTPTAASITSGTATLGSDVTSTGGAAISKRGVLFAMTSVNATPTLDGTGVTEVDAAATVGVFTESITGLTAITSYSFVAYATNSVGTTYTSISTFTTQAVAPTVTSPSMANVTSTSATLGGDAISNGGADHHDARRGLLLDLSQCRSAVERHRRHQPDDLGYDGRIHRQRQRFDVRYDVLVRGLCHQQRRHHVYESGLHLHDAGAADPQRGDRHRHADFHLAGGDGRYQL